MARSDGRDPRTRKQPVTQGKPPQGRRQGARQTGTRQAGARQPGQRPEHRKLDPRRDARFQHRNLERGARNRLRRFRQGTLLAVALTGLLLMLWGVEDLAAQDTAAAPQDTAQTIPAEAAPAEAAEEDPEEIITDPVRSVEQAARTMGDILWGFYGLLPRIVIAIVLILLALLVGNIVRWFLRRVIGERWERADAFATLAKLLVLLLAIGAGLSVIAGDARALVGSVGLVGLALSWALQTPIESFTGWLLNSMRGYYRVGDRIEVGDVFGDVFRIDMLTTTVWEAGGPGKAVAGAQATGAMITFPNWEVLRSNIVNYSREFPYVWDEITVAIANESDMAYTKQVLRSAAQRVLGDRMTEPAEQYRQLLLRARIAFDVAEDPQIFLSLDDSWTNFTIRYLTPARERRRWASDLTLAVSIELARSEHRGRIIEGYPVRAIKTRDDEAAAQG
jgi:small conductance mechanosensitive channel